MSVEKVRRCADFQATKDIILMAPSMATAAIHSNGEVGNDANPHCGPLCISLRHCEGAVGDPLEKNVIRNFVLILFSKSPHGGAARITPLRRPISPIPHLRLD